MSLKNETKLKLKVVFNNVAYYIFAYLELYVLAALFIEMFLTINLIFKETCFIDAIFLCLFHQFH